MRGIVSEYGKQIKHGLIEKGYSLETLAKMVSDKTGMYCDQPLLSRLISGEIKSEARPTITSAINEVLEIEV